MNVAKSKCFIHRNIKEIIRDPLSVIFCICFPALMLTMFTVINGFTAGYTPIFEPAALTPAMCCFSYGFVMLFTALLVSRDKTTGFLTRLYVSPLTTFDFTVGYSVPGMSIAIAQTAVCFLFGQITALVTNTEYLSLGGMALCAVSLLPCAMFYVALGIIFGSLFSDKAAPGISSVIISAGSMLSGAWMPLETMGGFEKFCRFLPFYPAVTVARQTACLSFDDRFALSFITMSLYAIAVCVLAVPAFGKVRKSI